MKSYFSHRFASLALISTLVASTHGANNPTLAQTTKTPESSTPSSSASQEPKSLEPKSPAPSTPESTPSSAQNQSSGKSPKADLKAASITGVLFDEKRERRISDAQVTLTKANAHGKDHKRFEVKSSEDGVFNFTGIEPGSWILTASQKNMLSHTTKVDLSQGENKIVTIALEDLESVDTLRVTGKRTLIHPERIGSQTNLDHKFIYQYKSGNDLQDLITSTPGVLNDSFGNVITRGEHNAINYEIDGVVLPEAAGVLQQSQLVTPRSLQNMSVNIGGYEASDGGGPLGAVAHMKSLPILAKPNLNVGHQIGGPLAGTIFYNGSTALSQDPSSVWNRVRIESSGAFRGSSYRLTPPSKNYVNNNAFDLNSLSKIEFLASEKDTFRLMAGLNATLTGIPTSTGSRAAGFHGSEKDGQHYLIASYIRRGDKLIDEANIHFVNAFYYQRFRTSIAFDPYVNFNAEQPLYSLAANAKRFNYIFSAQGNALKTVKKSHHLKAGFFTELRPVSTTYNAVYYNADLTGSLQQQAEAQGQIQQTNEDISATQESINSTNDEINSTNAAIAEAEAAGDTDAATELQGTVSELQESLSGLNTTLSDLQNTAAGINPNPFPYGALISPWTGNIGGPQFLGPVGKFRGFRYLQSAYFQDKFTPQNGFWKRLTLDAGVRFDLQRAIYGNSLQLAQTMAALPETQPFSLKPFMSQRLTNAQASGRYGGTFVVGKSTVIRGSYSDIFTPTPIDYFLTPINVTETPVAGIYPGTPRPLSATRGKLIDTSIETQIGPRFSTRTNLFWKYLTNFGDSGVVGNLPLYNRLVLAAQNAYGVETRIDLKSAKDGYGFNGFLSNTVQVAYLRKDKTVSGGKYEFPEEESEKFPDHDRRLSMVAGLGYKTRQNFWILATLQVLTGLQDSRDVEIYGPHNARTPVFNNLSISAGYQPPPKVLKKRPYLPASFDVRVENALNQRVPINLGSPFQGTRFSLPIRVLAGFAWQLGPQEAKLSSKPAPNSIRTLSSIPNPPHSI